MGRGGTGGRGRYRSSRDFVFILSKKASPQVLKTGITRSNLCFSKISLAAISKRPQG